MKRREFIQGLAGLGLAGLGADRLLGAPGHSKTKLVFWLFDGCRLDTLARLCDEGKLPTLARLRSQGLWVDSGITVFPSTTGPAYAPFIDGLLPATSGLAGIRQYQRKSGTYRTYCGTDSSAIKDDLNPDFPTIFELLPPEDSLSVFGVVDRGAKRTSRPLFQFLIDTLTGNLLNMDRHSFDAFRNLSRGGLPSFSFATFHAPDSIGHREGVDKENYPKALVQLDGLLATWLKDMEKRGELDNIVLCISADHGLDSTNRHGNIAELLRKKLGLTVQDAIGRSSMIFNARRKHHAEKEEAIISVSGNACVQIYLKGKGPRQEDGEPKFSIRPTLEEIRGYRGNGREVRGDLITTLFHEPCVGIVALRAGQGRYQVISRTGLAEILRRGDRLGYRVLQGKDPLEMKGAGALADGRLLPERQWLRATCQEAFPDAIFQIAQLLEAEDSGDLIINATPGYEPWFEGQNGVHGGLNRGQMQVPIMLWGKGIPRGHRLPCARTIDLFPTFLRILRLKQPKGVPGKALL